MRPFILAPIILLAGLFPGTTRLTAQEFSVLFDHLTAALSHSLGAVQLDLLKSEGGSLMGDEEMTGSG